MSLNMEASRTLIRCPFRLPQIATNPTSFVYVYSANRKKTVLKDDDDKEEETRISMKLTMIYSLVLILKNNQ